MSTQENPQKNEPKIHLNDATVTKDNIPKTQHLPEVPQQEFKINTTRFRDLGSGARQANKIPGQP